MMQSVMNASDVRREFGKFIDDTVRIRPQAIKRNRDIIFSLSLEHFREVLSGYELTFEYEQDEDGRFVGVVDQIDDIVADGESLEELKYELARHLIAYAHDYYEDFEKYYRSPNRKRHFQYVIRILLEDDIEKVARLLHA
ncbi:MAG: hypothetical protein ACRC5C_08400 [Bacilli bacterium]